MESSIEEQEPLKVFTLKSGLFTIKTTEDTQIIVLKGKIKNIERIG